jgi:hypothetical protein
VFFDEKGGGIMDRDGQCDCPKWGISCMVVEKVPEGIIVKMDWSCFTLEYFRAKDENCKNLKHTLDKGGVIDA